MDQQKEYGGFPASTTPGSTFLDVLTVIVKYRRFVSRLVLGATLLTALIAFLSPKWYKSSASVFPAERADLLGAADGVSSLIKSFSPVRALSSLTGNTEVDRYLAILKSTTVLDSVIKQFDLEHVYDITSFPQEKTAKELLSNVEFSAETEGNLTITVYDRDPFRAADMANYFVAMLNRTNAELQVQNAKGNRLFIEERYSKNLQDLAAAEDSMKAFQKRYGVIAMPEQVQASIKAGAEIAAQLAMREVEEGVLRRVQSPGHPSILSIQYEVQELRAKLAQMSSGGFMKAGDMNVFVPFSKVPELGSEYVRRYREVEIQYKILQFIGPLFEQAKVEERRQTPSVIVLDTARPAERKAKPKVALYALLALALSSLVSILVIFSRELIEKLERSHPGRLRSLLRTFTSDWFGVRFKRGA